MNRRLLLIAAAPVVALLWMVVFSPVPVLRETLRLERDTGYAPSGSNGARRDFAAVQRTIAQRSDLWGELVPPAATPAAPAPAAPAARPPDLAAMLKDVRVGRGQIGDDKVRLHTPEHPDGTWVAVGTLVNGCKLASVTPEQVIFTHYWEAGKRELSIGLKRP